MGNSGLGAKRISRAESTVSLKGMVRQCRSFFLDSGAHSLYNLHILNKPKNERHLWYADESGKLTEDFKSYLDEYARFLLKYKDGLDYYANVDAIYNPELSWKALKYLEGEYGLKPVPVIHRGTSLKWVEKHLEFGYKYIGLGGLGQESTKSGYYKWADSVYNLLCDNHKRLPVVRTHGFAMASYDLMLRYPWYSVDATSAFKVAGFGGIMVPHKRNGEFTFAIAPYIIAFSHRSSAKKVKGKHYANLTPGQQGTIKEWLDSIDMPLGAMGDNDKVIEYGVSSEYNARAVANLKFFQHLCNFLPKWPWPFNKKLHEGFFDYGSLK